MKKKFTVQQMCFTAVMAAVMCILGPMSIQIGPIPLSFTNLAILFAVYLLGTKLGTMSYAVYFCLGAFGLPVFSGYSGGFAKIAGPTGGYLVGFFLLAIISGLFIAKYENSRPMQVLGIILGMAVDYALGTAWFVFTMDCTVGYALAVCVVPFLIGDGIKIVLATALGPVLAKRLQQAGLQSAI